jgi:hypothetical protein
MRDGGAPTNELRAYFRGIDAEPLDNRRDWVPSSMRVRLHETRPRRCGARRIGLQRF